MRPAGAGARVSFVEITVYRKKRGRGDDGAVFRIGTGLVPRARRGADGRAAGGLAAHRGGGERAHQRADGHGQDADGLPALSGPAQGGGGAGDARGRGARALRLAAQVPGRGHPREPAAAQRGHPRAGAAHGPAHGRHDARGPRQDAAQAPAHPADHAGVALPAADRAAQPGHAAHGPGRDRGRAARPDRLQARGAPDALAGAAGRPLRPARAAHRALGHDPAAGARGAVPGAPRAVRRRRARPAQGGGHPGHLAPAGPAPCAGHGLDGPLPAHLRALPGRAHGAGLCGGPPAGRAPGPRRKPARRGGLCAHAPRLRLPGTAPGGRAAAARGEAAPAVRDLLHGAGDRRGPGGLGRADRLPAHGLGRAAAHGPGGPPARRGERDARLLQDRGGRPGLRPHRARRAGGGDRARRAAGELPGRARPAPGLHGRAGRIHRGRRPAHPARLLDVPRRRAGGRLRVPQDAGRGLRARTGPAGPAARALRPPARPRPGRRLHVHARLQRLGHHPGPGLVPGGAAGRHAPGRIGRGIRLRGARGGQVPAGDLCLEDRGDRPRPRGRRPDLGRGRAAPVLAGRRHGAGLSRGAALWGLSGEGRARRGGGRPRPGAAQPGHGCGRRRKRRPPRPRPDRGHRRAAHAPPHRLRALFG